MKISVVVPTITGREDHYARCVAAYERTLGDWLDLITVKDQPTCGVAWNIGAAQAKGDYIHFSADDLEPHDGWDIHALKAADSGWFPAPRIVNPNGDLDYCGIHGFEMDEGSKVDMSVIPFMSAKVWEDIGPSLPIHYFSDNYLSFRAKQAGLEVRVARGFAFTHHWADVGRGAGMSYAGRMEHDRGLFLAAIS